MQALDRPGDELVQRVALDEGRIHGGDLTSSDEFLDQTHGDLESIRTLVSGERRIELIPVSVPGDRLELEVDIWVFFLELLDKLVDRVFATLGVVLPVDDLNS